MIFWAVQGAVGSSWCTHLLTPFNFSMWQFTTGHSWPKYAAFSSYRTLASDPGPDRMLSDLLTCCADHNHSHFWMLGSLFYSEYHPFWLKVNTNWLLMQYMLSKKKMPHLRLCDTVLIVPGLKLASNPKPKFGYYWICELSWIQGKQ